MNVLQITSLDEPGLEPYRTLRRPMDHQRQGIFVAEGEKVVGRLLESGLEVLSALLTPEWLGVYRPLLEGARGNITVFVASKPLAESIVGFHLHQGIMAVGRIPVFPQLSQVLKQASRPWLLVAVDGLTNAENLGVLVRNCAAFGVTALLVGETSSSPYLRRAVRNSMGTIFSLPVVHVNDLATSLGELRTAHAVRIVAAHPHAAETLLATTILGTDCCLVFGSEGNGINATILAVCDEAVKVPMHEPVDSLNVASASAVFLYEAWRQRGGR
jgi:tRNA G18 (ribose-2'-O)-methylase SpoU